MHFIFSLGTLIAGKKRKGCEEKEGETIKDKNESFLDSIMSIAIYSFWLFIQYIFLTITPLPLLHQHAASHSSKNSKWVLHQGYGNVVNT